MCGAVPIAMFVTTCPISRFNLSPITPTGFQPPCISFRSKLGIHGKTLVMVRRMDHRLVYLNAGGTVWEGLGLSLLEVSLGMGFQVSH